MKENSGLFWPKMIPVPVQSWFGWAVPQDVLYSIIILNFWAHISLIQIQTVHWCEIIMHGVKSVICWSLIIPSMQGYNFYHLWYLIIIKFSYFKIHFCKVNMHNQATFHISCKKLIIA